MGGEEREQPELRAGQAHRPGAGRPGGRRHALAQLARLVDERAQARAELEHPLGLAEHRAGGAGVAEREMGARQLEPDLRRSSHGMPWSSSGRSRWARGERGAGVVLSAPRGARPAPSPRARSRSSSSRRARLVDDRLCRPRALRRLVPGAPLRGEERELCLRQVDLLDGADGLADLDRPPSGPAVARSVAPSSACATPRPRSAVGTHWLVRGQLVQRQLGVGQRLLDTAGASCAPAGSRPTGSIVALPSESGIAEVAPSASASHRSASAGRPVIARSQAP